MLVVSRTLFVKLLMVCSCLIILKPGLTHGRCLHVHGSSHILDLDMKLHAGDNGC
ncbi:hypothetical protein BDV96DRAFT_566806 [Lophiotrema nucula]|uniref:Uncharacterized protein n=1 Tax=Lophiotrema nucula TaxID=690887 RepID=A0A6A5ZKI4_9PLEO|nr:hypothetical protein BDV96DRAFT_566806 [Lophiotrema nucula]